MLTITRSQLSFLSFSILFLLLIQCSDNESKGGLGEPCENRDDCLEGLICFDGFCLTCTVECGELCCTEDEECIENQCVSVCESVRCNGLCCDYGQTCHNDTCCNSNKICGEFCCGEDEQCSDNTCIKCESTLCSGVCCNEGEVCVGSSCCEESKRCGYSCCGDGEICSYGECIIDCGNNVRCGENCCSENEVCYLGECTLPGNTCENNFECEEDQYCDPVLERCLDLGPEVECEYRPPVEEFTPSIEWHWEGYLGNPEFHNVISIPLVGDVDGDTLPEIVITPYSGNDCHTGVAVVLNGEDGSELWSIDDINYRFDSTAHGVLADVDSDGRAEVALPLTSGGFCLIDDNGTIQWTYNEGTASNSLYGGALAVADIDQNGTVEFVFGGVIVGVNGNTIADYGPIGSNWNENDGRNSYMPSIYDIDGDNILDIAGGGRVLNGIDGSIMWENPDVNDGFTAVADFGNNGVVDVAVISSGKLYILNGEDGAIIYSNDVVLPENVSACLTVNRGGAPTIADFDKDGNPEIAAAGCGAYTVYDPDCKEESSSELCLSGRTDGILWTVETQDYSSSATGSSVFDFEADGKAEVVYNDECYLRVYEGSTGRVLFEVPNSSRTGSEYPVIVDIDNDGNSEIVVGANDDQIIRDKCIEGTHGVFVYGDSLKNWVRTRPIWNEHTYHVTNVGVDGIIPAQESPNYSTKGLNNYRQNVQTEGIFNTSNLVPMDLAVDTIYCPRRYIIKVRVLNQGAAGVTAGVPVGFYRGTPDSQSTLLGVATTQSILLPGMSEIVSFTWEVPEDETEDTFTFFVIVDDANAGENEVAVHECNENDNVSGTVNAECVSIE